MSGTDHVLIAGAGIAGLTAALCLNKAGIDATVYEAQPEHADAGASFFIWKQGQRVLDQMGLLSQVMERSLPMPDRFITLGGETGREILPVPFDLEESNSAGARCIDRSTFMHILLDQIHEQGVELVYGKRLHTLEQTPHAVEVAFTDGTKAQGEVLIGAEGRRSPTRSHLFPQTQLRYARGWNVYGRSHTHTLDRALAQELARGPWWVHQKADLVWLAYRDDPQDPTHVTWLLSGTSQRKLPAKSFEFLDRDVLLQELVQGMRTVSPPCADIIATSTRIAPTQVFHLPALPAWSQGRVALIGDAVHSADPHTGTGATMALEDGMYVAKMLREHHYIDAFYYLHADRHQAAEKFNAEIDPTRQVEYVSEAMTSYSFDVGWEAPDTVPLARLMPPTTA